MGLIREPKDIEFEVISKSLTEKDKQQISNVISHYKKTGEIKKIIKESEKKIA